MTDNYFLTRMINVYKYGNVIVAEDVRYNTTNIITVYCTPTHVHIIYNTCLPLDGYDRSHGENLTPL